MVVSDEALLAGMAGGDEDAASAFVRRYQARVYGLALTIVGIPALAEDVAQEAFVKAWRHAATYDARRGRVVTWLLTITRNSAIDAVRYRHDSPMDPDVLVGLLTVTDEGSTQDDPDDDLGLREALAELPPEQSGPIVLMTYLGFTAQEVASREDLPLGTVKSRVRQGLLRLRRGLGVRHG